VTFTITLKTNEVWSGTEAITLKCNDSDEGTFVILASGTVTATPADISVVCGSTDVTSGTTIQFGSTYEGTTVAKTFTITNTGGTALNLAAKSFANTSHFTVTAPSSLTVAANGSVTFTVTLKADAAGSFSDAITIYSDDSDEGAIAFTVAGTVIATSPEIVVTYVNGGTTTNVADGQTTAIGFGSTTVGGTGASITFTIKNTGTKALTLNASSFVDTTHFTVGQPGATTLGVNESTTFTVTLKTNTAWSGTETVSFTNSDSDEGIFTFVVSGTVIATSPEITVSKDSTAITSGQASAINVGSARVGDSGPSITITIKNDGTAPLVLNAASFANTSHFTVTAPSSLTVAAGNSVTFTITLKTNVAWSGTEAITILSNDSDEGVFTFNVAGSVAQALFTEMTVLQGETVLSNGQAAAIDFGSLLVGAAGTSITITIRNDGNTVLTLNGDSFVNTDHFTVSKPEALTLIAGETTTFTITLKTGVVWTGAETISFTSNDTDSSPFTFNVSGTVYLVGGKATVLTQTGAIIKNTTTAVRFAASVHNDVGSTQTFTVRNDGDAALVFNANSFISNSHFTVSAPSTLTLAAGESITFTVALKTDAVWTGRETISFSYTDVTGAVRAVAFRVYGKVTRSPADISVHYNASEIVNGQITAIDLGSAVRGSDGVSITITVYNDGDKTLRLSSSTFASTSHFTVSKPNHTAITAGKTATFTITLKTDEIWSGTELVSFASTDSDETPFSFYVTGEVTNMSAEITVLDGGAILESGDTSAVSVGTAAHNSQGVTKTFTIRNDGDETLTLAANSFTNSAHFLVTTPEKLTLLAGESTTFTVTLITSEVWSGSEYISFNNNDGDNGDGVEGPFTIRLSGRVERASAEIVVLNGDTRLTSGQSVETVAGIQGTIGQALTLTIRNDGDVTLALNKSTFANTSHFAVSGPDDLSLVAGETTTFTVTLLADKAWSGTESLVLSGRSTDGVTVSFVVLLSGNVTVPSHAQTTIGGYDAATSTFYLKVTNATGTYDVAVQYGPAGSNWIPIIGDWDGDGIETIGLYNPSASTFHLKNSFTGGKADVKFQFGAAACGWAPIVGDWNGDGKDTIGLYNGVTSTFYLKDSLSGGKADAKFGYGAPGAGWIAIAGDWDGNGKDTIGLYDPTSSTFFLKNSLSGGKADNKFVFGTANSGCTPIVGDWTGNGTDSIGLYNAKKQTFYQKYTNSTGDASATFTFTSATKKWTPVAGAWSARKSLVAADGEITTTNASTISQTDLQTIANEAIARWAATGLDAASVAKLSSVEFVLTDLGGSHLGLADVDSNVIYIDSNAAGHGWYVDSTPATDEEFIAFTDGKLSAISAKAVDQIDLLTVVEHELGHILGLNDIATLKGGVMSDALEEGVRWDV
jgi:hypothetical protein